MNSRLACSHAHAGLFGDGTTDYAFWPLLLFPGLHHHSIQPYLCQLGSTHPLVLTLKFLLTLTTIVISPFFCSLCTILIQTPWDSGGQLWTKIYHHTNSSVLVFQLVMVGIFGLNSSYQSGLWALIPLPIITGTQPTSTK